VSVYNSLQVSGTLSNCTVTGNTVNNNIANIEVTMPLSALDGALYKIAVGGIGIEAKVIEFSMAVGQPVGRVSAVEIDQVNPHIKVGETMNLTATVLPSTATNKNVTWQIMSSHVRGTGANGKLTWVQAPAGTNIITLNSNTGQVTGVTPGMASVRVYTADGNYNVAVDILVDDGRETVIVKYVDRSDHNIILNTINEGGKQIGSTYNYTVPASYTSNGSWTLANPTNLNRTHTVKSGLNEILVEYDRVGGAQQATVTVKYVDKNNLSNVLNTITTTPLTVGTTYAHTVPEDIMVSGVLWRTEDYGIKLHPVVSGTNEMIIQYINVPQEIEGIVNNKYITETNGGINYIKNINVGTSVATIVQNLNLPGYYILEFKNIGGTIITNTNNVGTGSTVTAKNQMGETIKIYTIVVKGDITGDGAVNFVDIVRMIQYVYEPEENFVWIEAIRMAGKVVGSAGTPGFADIMTIIRHCYDGPQW